MGVPIEPEEFERGFPPSSAVHRGRARGRSAAADRGGPQDAAPLHWPPGREDPVHPIGATAPASGLVLAQWTADDGGEPAVPSDLSAGLDPRGAPIGPDAASCQPRVAATIVERGGGDPIALEGARRTARCATGSTRMPSRPAAGCGRARTSGATGTAVSYARGRLGRPSRPGRARPGSSPLGRACVASQPCRPFAPIADPAPNAPRGVGWQTRRHLTRPAAPRHAPPWRSAPAGASRAACTGRSTPASRRTGHARDRDAAADPAVPRRVALDLARADATAPGGLGAERERAIRDEAAAQPPAGVRLSAVAPPGGMDRVP